MHLRLLAASLLMGAVILFVPASTGAVPITVHTEKKVPVVREVVEQKNIVGEAMLTTALVRDMKTITVERVEHVAPVDEDDDGVADSEDDCVFCAPEPVYRVSGTNGYSGDGTSSSPIDGYYGAGGSTVQCESGGDYSAVDPSGTYWGGWQFDQQTWDAYAPSGEWGSATPAEQDAAAAAVPYDAWPNC